MTAGEFHGLGLRVTGAFWIHGMMFRVWGLGVQGFGAFRVCGLGFRALGMERWFRRFG